MGMCVSSVNLNFDLSTGFRRGYIERGGVEDVKMLHGYLSGTHHAHPSAPLVFSLFYRFSARTLYIA